jgi:hypothetical protein
MKDLDQIIAARSGNQSTTTEPEAQVVDNTTEELQEEVAQETETASLEDLGSESQESEPQESETSEVEQTASETGDQEAVKPIEPVAETAAELDLDEYTVDVNGEEKTINQLLDERDEYAKRIEEIESDEFLKRFIDYYKQTGDAAAFLRSQTVDYDKMQDVDVIRQKFDEENSDLDQETRDLLFSEELRSKYKVDPDINPEELEYNDARLYKIGQGLLKRDAEKARKSLKEQQQKFALPDKSQQQQSAPAFDAEAYKKKILSSGDMAKFTETKLLKLSVAGEDSVPYGYEIDNPGEIIEMMTNDSKFWSLFQKDGKIDHARQAKVYAYAKDPDAFERQLVELGKTLATEKVLKEKRNTDGVLSRTGKDNVDDFKTGFLKAARQQLKK